MRLATGQYAYIHTHVTLFSFEWLLVKPSLLLAKSRELCALKLTYNTGVDCRWRKTQQIVIVNSEAREQKSSDQTMASGSRDWGKPPANYVAGVGRGAMGFTTRSDIGPARLVADKPEGESGASGEGAGGSGGGDNNAGPDEFDEFEGNDKGLFASGEYDEDDVAADNVWAAVDARMDTRRKDRREARLKEVGCWAWSVI